MEQLLHAFGIDGKLIIIQIINFVVLAAALTYFLYNPVLKILREREEKIAQGIKDAERAEAVHKDAAAEKKAIVTAANQEAEAMAARAKTYADEQAAEIVAAAHSKAEQKIADATMRGDELKAQAQKESEAEIAKLAILAAEKVLQEKSS